MEKFTKRNIYTALINFANTGKMTFDTDEATIEVGANELKAFAENEIGLLDKKAAKAKETAAKKRTEGDAITAAVLAALTDEFEAIADIAARVDAEDATVAKVTYRLNALVEAGQAEKTDMKVPTGDGKKTRTIKGYRIADADAEQATEGEVE